MKPAMPYFFTWMLAGLAWLILFTPSPARAFSQDCSGSHCTIVANYEVSRREGYDLLHTAMSMNTQVVPFGIVDSEGGQSPFVPGASFTVPIEADGEIVGHAISFYDSPPIFFNADGVVRAVTEGLSSCRARARQERSAARQSGFCTQGSLAGSDDILGAWRDSWQVFRDDGSGSYAVPAPDVSCTSATHGTQATCVSTSASVGMVRLQFTRTVTDMKLGNELPHGQGFVSAPMTSSIFVEFKRAGAPKAVITTQGVHVGQEVTADGLKSTDEDGTIEAYSWQVTDPAGNVVSLPDAALDTITFPGSLEGPYLLSLQVTDNDGLTNTAHTSVSVFDNGPVADIKASGSSVNQVVTLDGSGSFDPDFACCGDTIVAYAWRVLNPNGEVVLEEISDQPITRFTPNQEGDYQVTLIVTDSNGKTGFKTIKLPISQPAFDPGGVREVD